MSTMKLPNYVCAVAAAACWFLVATAVAADWKPADGPLMTRWAKDVNPDKCLPEYPRPQMRRDAWLNLNGVWQLAFGKEGEQPPVKVGELNSYGNMGTDRWVARVGATIDLPLSVRSWVDYSFFSGQYYSRVFRIRPSDQCTPSPR